jgi:hypothetical protein
MLLGTLSTNPQRSSQQQGFIGLGKRLKSTFHILGCVDDDSVDEIILCEQ